MNISRRGKIARLPEEVRRQLNVRLRDGEPGKRLVAWLNTLPEARAVLEAEFAGSAVREQDLSRWRQGGYAAWLEQQEALEMIRPLTGELAEPAEKTGGVLTDRMALWLAMRYLVASRKREEAGENIEGAWNRLREFCSDLVRLRRGDHSAERLKLAREKWDFSQQDKYNQALSYSLEATKEYPEVRERFREAFALFKERRAGGAQR